MPSLKFGQASLASTFPGHGLVPPYPFHQFAMKRTFVILSLLFGSLWSVAQTTTFSIRVEEDSITGMPGLQSFVRGIYLGKWILIGGRTDGLHRRQPFASFDPVDNNTTIYQVDPVGK
jgi:hypothetical protein